MAAPRKLGKYEVVGVIGKGAMGVVYKGHDPVLERPVALKTVSKEQTDQDLTGLTIARFKNEALAAGRLSHSGIVGVYDYGETKQLAYIAMEFVEGRGLREFLARKERFGIQDVMSIMSQLLDALDYAHDHGVVHRDVKPANIIMTPSGRLKVADFGIARLDRSNLTQVGSIMGTPAYMSPEQYAGLQVDRRSDIFSCGVVLYELLTGVKPFEGPTESVGYKICHEPHRNPSELDPQGAPAAFDPILARALAKKANERYPNARDFAKDLTRAFASGGGGTIPSEVTVVVPTAANRGQAEGAFPPTGREDRPLKELETLLTSYVGPVGKVLVRKALKTAADSTTLVRLLADSIPQGKDRERFVAQALEKVPTATRASPEHSSPSARPVPIADADIEKAASRLAAYLGPIARVLAKKTASQTVGLGAFYRQLSQSLADPDQRAEFLRKAGYRE